jgi:hypothetical protein
MRLHLVTALLWRWETRRSPQRRSFAELHKRIALVTSAEGVCKYGGEVCMIHIVLCLGVRGSGTMLLCYKPEGRWFNTR